MPNNAIIAIVHSDVPSDAPEEEQDTLEMARQLAEHIQNIGLRALLLPWQDGKVRDDLDRVKPSLIFNLVESINGRADNIHVAPDMFAQWGYAYIGAGAEALRLTTDKLATKDVMRRHQLPTPLVLPEAYIAFAQTLDGSYILKSRMEEGSCGIFPDSVTNDAENLRSVLADRKSRFGGEWFAEKFISGREFHISILEDPVLGPIILPLAEINFSRLPAGRPRIVDYTAKWDETSFLYDYEPCLFDSCDPDLERAISEKALRCWKAFGLKGWARIDFRVEEETNIPYLIDINAGPSLAEGCIFMCAAYRAGLDYPEIISALIGRDSISSKGNKQIRPKS